MNLDKRMKLYELQESGRTLLPGVPVIARMDGRCFHNYTRNFSRPFSSHFSESMISTTMSLMEETNALVGYTQSDEISLLWMDNVYFDRRVHKMVSHLAAQTTLWFYKQELGRLFSGHPTFDARVWVVPTKQEAANYFLWREQDAVKNSVSMAAHHYYSQKELDGKHQDERQEMLFQKGINWNDYDPHFKRGTFVRKEVVEGKLSTEDLDSLPPLHHARQNPDMSFTRSEIKIVTDFEGLSKCDDKVRFLFGDQHCLQCC